MRISKIHLTNFKRFADLLIDNIPSTSKLVLLIGANGSGKSSLFDAFGFVDAAIKQENETQSAIVAGYLNSNEFDTYYKSLPMKSYCTQLPQRQNIPKSDLAKTQWFKAKMEELLHLGQ